MKDSRYVAIVRPTLVLEFAISRKESEAIRRGGDGRKVREGVEGMAVAELLERLKGSALHVLEASVSSSNWTYSTLSWDTERRISKVRAWQVRRDKRLAQQQEV